MFFLTSIVLFFTFSLNLLLSHRMMNQKIETGLIDDFKVAYNTTENFIDFIAKTSQMCAKEMLSNQLNFQNIDHYNTQKLSTLLTLEKSKMSADVAILLDEHAVVLAQTGSEYSVGDSLEYHSIVKQTLKTHSQITKIAREKETFIIYSSALIKNNNTVTGLLLVGYFINDTFLDNIKNNTPLEIAFVGNSAIMSATKWGGHKNLEALPVSYLNYQKLLRNPDDMLEIIYQEKAYIVTVKPLHLIETLISGSILFAYPYDHIKQEKYNILNKKIVVFIISLMFALLLIYGVIRKYTRSIELLTQAMNNLSRNGVYKRLYTNTNNDEIRLLVHSFNNMGDELNRLHNDFEQTIAERTHDLVSAKEEAEKANRSKSEFLSQMSHELRTPMNAILGFAQMLEIKNDNLITTQKDHVKEILHAGHHLLALINELLDLARIESGKTKVCIEKIILQEVLEECLQLLSGQLHEQKIELINRVSVDVCYIYADRRHLKQVLINLLSNAIKYNSRPGKIILDAKLLEKYDDKQFLHITITDTGKGLNAEEIKQLFSPFKRLNCHKNIEGTGIGLTITKNLVEMMKGKIGVDSVVGEGSTFWIDLRG